MAHETHEAPTEAPTPEAPPPDEHVVLPAAEVLELLFERAPEIITITDADGRQSMVNAAGLRLLGFDEGFRRPPDGLLFVHPDDRPRLLAHREHLLDLRSRGRSAEQTPALRYRVRSGTGEWRWLESLFTDMSDVPGIGGRVAFSRDVTEAEEHRQALLESEARLAAMVSSFRGGAFVEGSAGRVLLANDRLGELFDLDAAGAALVGGSTVEVVERLSVVADDPTTLRGVAASGHGAHHDVALSLVTGRDVDVEVVPITDGDAALGRLWLFHDATARRTEERRQRVLLELEQQARRAAEGQAEQLQAYDRLRNDFVAGVSHDLRTPLTAIVSASELLLADPQALPADVLAPLDIIRRNADRLRHLIEDLLLVGRLDAGMLQLEHQVVAVDRLVADVVVALAPVAAARQVEVRTDVDDDLVLWSDPRRLSEALTNLVDNAIKFTATGSVVRVRGERRGAHVAIAVEDHGPGIPPEQRATVFERFMRTSDAERAGTPGSGLGLAIVKGLVELHGGTVAIDDAEGGGTVVTCLLPGDPVEGTV